VIKLFENIPKTNIYAFNIVCEAKVLTLVDMTKKFHPDWSNEEIKKFLQNAVEYAVKTKLGGS